MSSSSSNFLAVPERKNQGRSHALATGPLVRPSFPRDRLQGKVSASQAPVYPPYPMGDLFPVPGQMPTNTGAYLAGQQGKQKPRPVRQSGPSHLPGQPQSHRSAQNRTPRCSSGQIASKASTVQESKPTSDPSPGFLGPAVERQKRTYTQDLMEQGKESKSKSEPSKTRKKSSWKHRFFGSCKTGPKATLP